MQNNTRKGGKALTTTEIAHPVENVGDVRTDFSVNKCTRQVLPTPGGKGGRGGGGGGGLHNFRAKSDGSPKISEPPASRT